MPEVETIQKALIEDTKNFNMVWLMIIGGIFLLVCIFIFTRMPNKCKFIDKTKEDF